MTPSSLGGQAMSEKIRNVLLLAASFAATMGGATPVADAAWSRTHTTACYPTSSSFTVGTNGVTGTTSNVGLYCPFDDDDRFAKGAVVTLNLHGFHSTSGGVASATAMACRTYWGSNGGACGSVDSYSGYGNYTLHPALSQWASTYSGDFGYVYWTLGYIYSTARGLYAST